MGRNDDLAAAFEELADLLEIASQERFKIVAYRRAAEVIGGLTKDVAELSEAELTKIRGIGKAISSKSMEFVRTGTIAKLEEARAALPPGVLELTQLSGLGPKKALLIAEQLGVSTIPELADAVALQRVRSVKGLGAKTEQNLQRALKAYEQGSSRTLLDVALDVAESVVSELRSVDGVRSAAYAGSLRRMKETVGDLDILVAGGEREEVMARFVHLPVAANVAAQGQTKSSLVTRQGLQVDLRVVEPDEFGAAMQYFTGSQAHNVRVREIAVKAGLKLSEYGVFRVQDDVRIAAATEDEVYAALGMQTPPPTMRENRGEIELAQKGELPRLVQTEDLRGDLHSHSTYSDGRAGMAEMIEAAQALGYEYYAITDHGRMAHVHSLTEQDIERQAVELRRLNESLGGRIRVLHGVELNIGPNGELDYPDDILAKFDVVVASVHHALQMPRSEMTKRVLAALRHPQVNIFGHPTARRIGRREPIELDLDAVFKTAAEHSVALEINSNPSRLDLRDDHVRLAREYGCRLSIDSDAHMIERLQMVRIGVGTAQRAWVEPDEVINTWPLDRLVGFFEKT